MPQAVRHCAMCSGPSEMKALAAITGEDGPLRITLRGMPALVCLKNHKAPVHRDFMLWLIQQIRAREEQFAAGKEQGMVFKKHCCGECGAALAAKPERREALPFDLAYEGTPSFKAEIEMPLYKCTACGKEQLRSLKDLHGHVPAAMVGINDGAGFPHSG